MGPGRDGRADLSLSMALTTDYAAASHEFSAHASKILTPYVDETFRPLLTGIRPVIADDLRLRATNHLFASHLCAADLRLSHEVAIQLARVLLVCYSIPVTLLGTWVDSKAQPTADDWLAFDVASTSARQADDATYRASTDSLLRARVDVERSIQKERANRFSLGALSDDSVWQLPCAPGEFYRSECTYLRAACLSVACASGAEMTAGERQALLWYGVARQVIDEMVDVAEDLTDGIVTLPVVAYCQEVCDTKLVTDVWDGTLSAAAAAETVTKSRSVSRCLDLISEAVSRGRVAISKSPCPSLCEFFDWKRAWLRDRGRRYGDG